MHIGIQAEAVCPPNRAAVAGPSCCTVAPNRQKRSVYWRRYGASLIAVSWSAKLSVSTFCSFAGKFSSRVGSGSSPRRTLVGVERCDRTALAETPVAVSTLAGQRGDGPSPAPGDHSPGPSPEPDLVQSTDRPVGMSSPPEPEGAVPNVLLVTGFQHAAHGTLDTLSSSADIPIGRVRPPAWGMCTRRIGWCRYRFDRSRSCRSWRLRSRACPYWSLVTPSTPTAASLRIPGRQAPVLAHPAHVPVSGTVLRVPLARVPLPFELPVTWFVRRRGVGHGSARKFT